MEEVRGASFAGSLPLFLGREWAAVKRCKVSDEKMAREMMMMFITIIARD